MIKDDSAQKKFKDEDDKLRQKIEYKNGLE